VDRVFGTRQRLGGRVGYSGREATVSESARRKRRTASAPPADRNRTAEGRRRDEDLARRLGLSPSSERGLTEEASLYPAEAFRDGLLRSARSEPCTTEEASSYLTEEFVNRLAPSDSAGRSAAEEASSHPTKTVTDELVPLVVPNAQGIEILDGLEISAAIVVVV
jgi:hypothetical protein